MNTKKNGFTIIELIVVVAIIAVLAAIVITNVNIYMVKARDARRKADIKQIMLALEMYYADNGQYPTGSWLTSNNTNWATLQTALAPYLRSLPKDPRQDTSGYPYEGKRAYGYYSNNYGMTATCNWYMLLSVPELSGFTSPGVTACNGVIFNYTGTITNGMLKN